ncbi:MAG TPA: helix-turn-helix domain-containing protein, partial [Thermoanaerobaculia bacterium]|nr:helix-turn-helix domain-containing protein [Thermoanaerobaculia bacterium]
MSAIAAVPNRHHVLFTSAEAARVFRVGVSSIKRWTDEGELESVRTPGGHRRYTAEALRRFASLRGLPADMLPPGRPESIPPPADITLFDALSRGDEAAVRSLVLPRVDSLAKRAAFFDRVVGDALREIGYRWERAALTVDQEHRASHMIAEAIDSMRPMPNGGSKLAVLACPPDEHHELPLHLVRLIFEWSGWRTELLGASLPWNAAYGAVMRARPAIFAFSSRNGMPYRYRDFDRFVEFCNQRSSRVIV